MASSPEEARAARLIGSTFGGWKLERVLGVGGMAAVYAATGSDGTAAALKLLHADQAIRPEIRDRFLREGMAANSVEHPGAVRIIDSATVEDEETAYLVMELLEGESLGERHGRSKLSSDEVLGVLDQTLDVLAVAHDRGIVHRDLKPDNLFLTREGRVKVLDFGLARFLDALPTETRTRTGIAMGTLPYMSPEQANGKRTEIDGRTDLFALGAMAFRLLSGRRIHQADSEAALLLAMATRPAPALLSVLPDAPQCVALIVDLALAFSRDARYPDARTMQSDVRAVRAGGPPPYASELRASRDEATSADRAAPVLTGAAASTAVAPVGAAVLPSPRSFVVGAATPGAATTSAATTSAVAPAVSSVANPYAQVGRARPHASSVSHGRPLGPNKAARKNYALPAVLILLSGLLVTGLLIGVGLAATNWSPSPKVDVQSEDGSGAGADSVSDFSPKPAEATGKPGHAGKRHDKDAEKAAKKREKELEKAAKKLQKEQKKAAKGH